MKEFYLVNFLVYKSISSCTGVLPTSSYRTEYSFSPLLGVLGAMILKRVAPKELPLAQDISFTQGYIASLGMTQL